MKNLIITFFVCISFSGISQSLPDISFPNLYDWKYVGNNPLVVSLGRYTSLALSPQGIPFIGFSDGNNNWKVTVMKFNGSGWDTVGQSGFSSGQAEYIDLRFNLSGVPYVAYKDYGNSSKATVMKFNGSTWDVVGNPGISAGSVYCTSLAINSSGVPYIAFIDVANAQKATVMKFDGNNWTSVGNSGFSPKAAGYLKIAMSPDDIPFVTFLNGDTMRLLVMKFNNTAWSVVGNGYISPFWAAFPNLAFSNTSELYLAYCEATGQYTSSVTVKKFVGSNWEVVGPQNISAGDAGYSNIAINSSGVPFVGYQDFYYGGWTSVKKFNGSNWEYIGDPGFGSTHPHNLQLAINFDGNPYIASDANGITVMKYDSVYVGLNKKSSLKLTLSPNPVKNELVIETKSDIKKFTELSILNSSGLVIYKCNSKWSGRTTLNTANWQAGIYFVLLSDDNNFYKARFIKLNE